ncbi:MAG: hypothetical protein JWP38_2438 [Herbaspirillum sp.]|nr:hypothetical protein [Herbaspirillum sp.]
MHGTVNYAQPYNGAISQGIASPTSPAPQWRAPAAPTATAGTRMRYANRSGGRNFSLSTKSSRPSETLRDSVAPVPAPGAALVKRSPSANAALRGVNEFLVRQNIPGAERLSIAETLTQLHALLHVDSSAPAPSFIAGALPQSDHLRMLIGHLATARGFEAPATDAGIRIDDAYQRGLVAQALLTLVSREQAANQMQVGDYSFLKAIRATAPIDLIDKSFSMALLQRLGRMTPEVADWTAALILQQLHPTLARTDTPSNTVYGDTEWADLAFAIDLLGAYGLDHGQFSHGELRDLAEQTIAGAKLNDRAAREIWRMQIPTALWFAHANGALDLTTQNIEKEGMAGFAVRYLDRHRVKAWRQQLDRLREAVETLEKPYRSREAIAADIAQTGPDLPPPHQHEQCVPPRPIADLERAVDGEWTIVNEYHIDAFSDVLATALNRSDAQTRRDWGTGELTILHPTLIRVSRKSPDSAIVRDELTADIGTIVRTRLLGATRYYAVSAMGEPISAMSGPQDTLRKFVTETPQRFLARPMPMQRENAPAYLFMDASFAESPNIEGSKEARALAVSQKLMGRAAHAGPIDSTPFLLAAKRERQALMPFSACFTPAAGDLLEARATPCGIALERNDMNMMRHGNSQQQLENGLQYLLGREIGRKVLDEAEARFKEQLFHSAGRPAKQRSRKLAELLHDMRAAATRPFDFLSAAPVDNVRIAADQSPPNDFSEDLLRMLGNKPSIERIRQKLNLFAGRRLRFSSAIGWQTDHAVPDAAGLGRDERVRDIAGADHVLLRQIRPAQREGPHTALYARVNPYNHAVFGPAIVAGADGRLRSVMAAPAIPSIALNSAAKIGRRFIIAGRAEVRQIHDTEQQARGIFTFDLNGRIYQTDLFDFTPQLRLLDQLRRPSGPVPYCRGERSLRLPGKGRICENTQQFLDSHQRAGRRINHPGHYIQAAPVWPSRPERPRREATIFFAENTGSLDNNNAAIVDQFMLRGQRRGNPDIDFPYESMPTGTRSFPNVAPLPEQIRARLIVEDGERPMIEYFLESDFCEGTSRSASAQVRTRIRRDFRSRRLPDGSIEGLLEIAPNTYYRFALPDAPDAAEIMLRPESERAVIDDFTAAATVEPLVRNDSAEFSVELEERYAPIIIDIVFRWGNAARVIDAIKTAMRRSAASGDPASASSALENYLVNYDVNAPEPPSGPILAELDLGLTEIMRMVSDTHAFRNQLRDNYRRQRDNVDFAEVRIPQWPAQDAMPEVEAERMELEMASTLTLLSDVFPALDFSTMWAPQTRSRLAIMHNEFERVFGGRNFAIAVVQPVEGPRRVYCSTSGTVSAFTAPPGLTLVRDVPAVENPPMPHIPNLTKIFSKQSRALDTERVIFIRLQEDFPSGNEIASVTLYSRLDFCHSCTFCCIYFAERYPNATMNFLYFPGRRTRTSLS